MARLHTLLLSLTICVGLGAAVVAVLIGAPAHAQGDGKGAGKNLKILPKTMTKEELKNAMKEMAKSVGKKCDGCHDVEAFDKDTEKKEIARHMMKMTAAINERLSKEEFDEVAVTCSTCHRGKEKPTDGK